MNLHEIATHARREVARAVYSLRRVRPLLPPQPPGEHRHESCTLPGEQDRVGGVPSPDGQEMLAWRSFRDTLALAVDQVPASYRRRPNSTFASSAPQSF